MRPKRPRALQVSYTRATKTCPASWSLSLTSQWSTENANPDSLFEMDFCQWSHQPTKSHQSHYESDPLKQDETTMKKH